MSAAPAGFSLVTGGPLHRLWLRVGLARDGLAMVRRRVLFIVLLTWMPLLVLSVLQREAWGGSVVLPFLYDIEVHVRLLLALPLLLVAEGFVHRRMTPVIGQFVGDGLITDATRSRFDQVVASIVRLRNSSAVEVVLILLVYTVGVMLAWQTQAALSVTSWYGVAHGARMQPSLAGWWLDFVSLPVFQFLLLRWYFRLWVWARFLWRVSRIELALLPAHPDRCGGLGFLSEVRVAYAPILLAQGLLLAGMMANRILFANATLPQFEVELIGMVGLMLFVILGPLVVFCGQLERASQRGEREYGALAQRFLRQFDGRWLQRESPDPSVAQAPVVPAADIQALASIGSTFDLVERMRWVPFTWQTVVMLAGTTLLPALPLTLTMFSPEELFERLLKVVF